MTMTVVINGSTTTAVVETSNIDLAWCNVCASTQFTVYVIVLDFLRLLYFPECINARGRGHVTTKQVIENGRWHI